MAKYESRAELESQIKVKETQLFLAKAKLAAFDWLVEQGVGSFKAAELIEWPDSLDSSNEFSEEEKQVFRSFFVQSC